MIIDIIKLSQQFNIPIRKTGKNVSGGWIGMCCPFCGDTGFHLGYNPKKNRFFCWKCGGHSVNSTIYHLTNGKCKPEEYISNSLNEEIEEKTTGFEVKYPNGIDKLSKQHKNYLYSRNLDAEQVEYEWNLLGTTYSKDYLWSNRIIIPIYLNNKVVSYTSRSIDGSEIKALHCSTTNSIVKIKETLLGIDKVESDTVVVTEGTFDVFNYGIGAVCTFGTFVTQEQIKLLNKFKRIFIAFDSEYDEYGNQLEKKAQKKAMQLADKLSIFCETYVIDELPSDIGSLSKEDVKHLKSEINKKIY